MNQVVAYVGGAYLLVCCLLGGLVAWRKGDFFSRGLCISLMGGIFVPIFFAFSPRSHAREGDQTDLDLWHVHGCFPPSPTCW